MEDNVQKVEKGQNWRHNKTGKTVIVLNDPYGLHGKVELLHESGRRTIKQQHYFTYDYSKIEEEN